MRSDAVSFAKTYGGDPGLLSFVKGLAVDEGKDHIDPQADGPVYHGDRSGITVIDKPSTVKSSEPVSIQFSYVPHGAREPVIQEFAK